MLKNQRCAIKRVAQASVVAATVLAHQTAMADTGDINARTVAQDGSTIHWSLTNADLGGVNAIAFLAPGSGCAPVRTSPNIASLAGVLSDFAVLTVEKHGVTPDDAPADPLEDCSNDYKSGHTVTRSVSDVTAVFDDLRERGLWRGKTLLMGGSEGGAVVSILSHELPETDAAVVISTGTGLTVAEFFPMVLPPPVATRLTDNFSRIRSGDSSDEMIFGYSSAWWRDILDRRLSDDLLESDAPLLLIHGETDRSAPVAAARVTRDAFETAGQSDRLTYREYEGFDHGMIDADGASHMEEVLEEAADWIRRQNFDDDPM